MLNLIRYSKKKLQNNLVSVVIPTKNSASTLEACLKSLKDQNYPNIEILLIDGGSTDNTSLIAKKYGARLILYNPKVKKGYFDAPYRRNFGVTFAKGSYVYLVDADMELDKGLILDCVSIAKSGYGAVIISEISFGRGVWANAKNLERLCYHGDNSIEAPRFFVKSVWNIIGGLDVSLGGGGDDWDIHEKLKERNIRVGRAEKYVKHNEGNLLLISLFRKRFMYGKDSILYLTKRPKQAVISYFPIRLAYLRNWKLFISRPIDSFFFLIMRLTEYTAGFLGIVYSKFIDQNYEKK